MKLAEVCVKRPVFATMLILTFVVLGIFSYTQLGVDLFPKIDSPTVTVQTLLPGASPEEVESQITKPIEEVINTISGIDELRSTTLEGTSLVIVSFVLDKNSDVAAQEVRDKVATVIGQLPRDTVAPVIARLDFDAAPILAISVYGNRPLRELTEIADRQIKQRLESVEGIGSIQMLGGRKREIQLWLDPDKLQAYRLTIDQVRNAIRAQDVEIPGGRIDQGPNELTLRTLGRIENVRDFETLVVGKRKGISGLSSRHCQSRRRIRGTAQPCPAGWNCGYIPVGSQTVRHEHGARRRHSEGAGGGVERAASSGCSRGGDARSVPLYQSFR